MGSLWSADNSRGKVTAVLLPSDHIHGLTEVLGDVELVMHDVRLRQALPGGPGLRDVGLVSKACRSMAGCVALINPLTRSSVP